ncbi:RNA polymerase sigma factor ShbA [Haloechinothrix alba]|nr:RNA polymerase sigma factor ShbA [Haloechinothrix alba]
MSDTAPEPASPDPLDELADAAASGDPDALGELLARLRPVIVRYCRARLGTVSHRHASADDVAQEVMLAVLGSLSRYRATGAGFLAFAYGIAANKVADAHRRRASDRSHPVAELPDVPGRHGPDPEQHAERVELHHQMRRMLGLLTAQQRDVLVLRVATGLSVAETATALSTTPGAVRIAQHRGLNRLRAELSSGSGTNSFPAARLD